MGPTTKSAGFGRSGLRNPCPSGGGGKWKKTEENGGGRGNRQLVGAGAGQGHEGCASPGCASAALHCSEGVPVPGPGGGRPSSSVTLSGDQGSSYAVLAHGEAEGGRLACGTSGSPAAL